MEVKKNSAFVASIDTKKLYERMRALRKDEVLTYSEMSALIGRDVRNGARSILQSAREMLQRHDGIVLDVVRTVGIRRMTNPEIANSGEADRKKIHRAAARGTRRLECAEYGELSNEDKVKHNANRSLLGALHQATRPATMKALERAVSESNDALTFARTLEAFKK